MIIMETFELYLDNYFNNLLLDKSCVWVAKYKWQFDPLLGVYTNLNGKKVTLLSMLTNSGSGYFLSNGNPTDYRMANIRKLMANSEQYKKAQAGFSSQFKGVTYREQRGKKPWLAQKSCLGKRILQKYFSSEIEAAMAYNQAVIKCVGHEKAFFGKMLNEFNH